MRSKKWKKSYTESSLVVELNFEQKFKLDPRIEQIRQLNSWIEQLEFEETEFVTYKFLGFEQKLLFKLESWTEILVQLENWIESSYSTCSKLNSATTLNERKKRFSKLSYKKIFHKKKKNSKNVKKRSRFTFDKEKTKLIKKIKKMKKMQKIFFCSLTKKFLISFVLLIFKKTK